MPAKLPLPLRLVVDDPVPSVALAVQSGKGSASALIPPARASAKAAVFEVEITASTTDDGVLVLSGPIVQGPPAGRFLYVGVGTYAGQTGTPWSRRIKWPLTGITPALVAALTPGRRLEAHIAGRDKKGEPACASVKLTEGWKVA
jgi:hypothetical protein